MSKSQNHVDPEYVRKIYDNDLTAQILRIALLLDIFSSLKDSRLDAKNVAEICHCNVAGIKLLLDCLCSLRFLERIGNGYSITPTAATFFVSNEKSYTGDWVLRQTDPNLFIEVLKSVRSGIPFQPSIAWEKLAWLESYDTCRIQTSREMWLAADVDPDQIAALNILDLGSGCSIMSFVLAEHNSCAKVTCIDNEKVLAVAKDLAARFNIERQITYLPGNLHDIPFKDNEFDVVHLGNVTNFFTETQNITLFQKIFKALKENGILLINVSMNTGEIDEFYTLQSFVLWSITGTFFYDFETYHQWLLFSGFSHIKKLSNMWIIVRK
jgi:ubiquinone/menaquinone biosynthesis C-methylase UbiE